MDATELKKRLRLTDLIKIVKENTEATGKWHTALLEINETQLYKLQAPTMAQFCAKVFGWDLKLAQNRWHSAKRWAGLKLLAETTGKAEPPKSDNVTTLIDTPEENKESSSSPPAPPAKPETPKDSKQMPIPKEAAVFWERRQEIQELMTSLSKVKSKIENGRKEKDPLFMQISQAAIDYASRCYQFISDAKPYAVCLDCQGRPSTNKGCRSCHGTGLICQMRYEHIEAKEKRMIREKAYKLQPT